MNIYLPIEFKERELGPKILLSNELRNLRDFTFYVGNYDLIIRKILKGELAPGIIIFKSIQRYLFPKLVILKILGFKFIHLEEESWVPFDTEDLLLRRYPLRNLFLISSVWMPIKIDFKPYSIRNIFKNKFTVVGHPRVNYFLKSQSSNNRTSDYLSKKILIISSFAYINNVNEYNFWNSTRDELGLMNSIFFRIKYKQIFNNILIDYEYMIAFIEYLISESFVVEYRPHPSENDRIISNRFPTINITPRDNYDLIEEKNYRYIVHFGSTFALDLIKNGFKNVVCLDPLKTPQILTNSKLASFIFNDFNFVKYSLKAGAICNSNSLEDLFISFKIEKFEVKTSYKCKIVNSILYFLLKKISFKISTRKANLTIRDLTRVISDLRINANIKEIEENIFMIKYE
jgi:surface carbohydrate biosynthesis protein